MANTRNGNTYYIDTEFSSTEELIVANLRVTSVIVTATAANARVVLGDSSIATKLDLRVATSGETLQFFFDLNAINFSTSIRPKTLTNAVVTCVLSVAGG